MLAFGSVTHDHQPCLIAFMVAVLQRGRMLWLGAWHSMAGRPLRGKINAWKAQIQVGRFETLP